MLSALLVPSSNNSSQTEDTATQPAFSVSQLDDSFHPNVGGETRAGSASGRDTSQLPLDVARPSAVAATTANPTSGKRVVCCGNYGPGRRVISRARYRNSSPSCVESRIESY